MSDSENSIKKSGSHVKICREVFDDFYDGPSKEGESLLCDPRFRLISVHLEAPN
jgi:hypothetical protein